MEDINNKFEIGDIVFNKIEIYDMILDEDSSGNNYNTYMVGNIVYEDSQYKYRFQDIDDESNFEKTPVHLGNVNYVKRSEVNGAKIMREEIDDGVKADIINKGNIDEFIFHHKNKTIRKSSDNLDSLTLDECSGLYSVIGVTDGEKQYMGSMLMTSENK